MLLIAFGGLLDKLAACLSDPCGTGVATFTFHLGSCVHHGRDTAAAVYASAAEGYRAYQRKGAFGIMCCNSHEYAGNVMDAQ